MEDSAFLQLECIPPARKFIIGSVFYSFLALAEHVAIFQVIIFLGPAGRKLHESEQLAPFQEGAFHDCPNYQAKKAKIRMKIEQADVNLNGLIKDYAINCSKCYFAFQMSFVFWPFCA